MHKKGSGTQLEKEKESANTQGGDFVSCHQETMRVEQFLMIPRQTPEISF